MTSSQSGPPRALDLGMSLARETGAESSSPNLADVLHRIHQGIAVFDANLVLRFWNERYVSLLNLPAGRFAVHHCRLLDILHYLAERGDYGPGGLDEVVQRRLATIRDDSSSQTARRTAEGKWVQVNWDTLADGGLVVMLTDITAVKEAEAAADGARAEAVRSRERLEAAIDAMSEGFVLWDAGGRLVICNARYRDEYSFAPELLRPGVGYEVLLRESVRRGGSPSGYTADEWIDHRLAQHRNPPPPYLVERADGRSVLIHEYRTKDGGIIGIRTDVTELRHKEREAREARERLVDAIEAIPQGFVIFDPDDRILLFNRSYKEKFSLVPDLVKPGTLFADMPREVLRRGLLKISGDAEAWIAERIATHRAGGRKLTTERNGRWVAIEESKTRSGHIVVIHTDVTELVQREREVAHSRQLLRDVIDAVPAVINVKDGTSRYILMNRFQGMVYGVSPDQAIGKRSEDFVGTTYGGMSREMDEQVLRTGVALPWLEREFAGKDGKSYIWLTTKIPLNDEFDRPRNVLTVALDITSLKETARARTNLARYLPPNLVDVLASVDEPLGAPRAQDVAVLFADLVGFTDFTAQHTPETVFALLRDYNRCLAASVFKCGGTLDEFTGDGLMAIFGTPYSSDRDAANAIECARLIVAEIGDLAKERVARGLPALRVKVGVHWGSALVGNIGDEKRLKFTVVGDTVNVASRLESLTRNLDVDVAASEAIIAQARREKADVANFAWSGRHTLRGRPGAVGIWTLRA